MFSSLHSRTLEGLSRPLFLWTDECLVAKGRPGLPSEQWLVAISYILVILARQRHCFDIGICVDIMKYRWSSVRAVLLDEEGEIEVREELVA